MKIKDIQKTIITDIINHKGTKYIIEKFDGYIVIGTPQLLYIFDNYEFVLDYDKLIMNDVKQITFAERLIKEFRISKTYETTDTTNRKIIENKEVIVLDFENFNAYVDLKLLKHFDIEDIRFVTTGKNTLIKVFEDRYLRGVVCPIKIN